MTESMVNFGLEDLQVVAKIIAAGSQRGAFKAEELQVVGSLYTKVMTILEANNIQPEPQPEQETEPESNTEGNTDD